MIKTSCILFLTVNPKQIDQAASGFFQLTRQLSLNFTESVRTLDAYYEIMNSVTAFFGANTATAMYENKKLLEFMQELASVWQFIPVSKYSSPNENSSTSP